jgi:hypothetical protein
MSWRPRLRRFLFRAAVLYLFLFLAVLALIDYA